MAVLQLRLAGEFPATNYISFVAERILDQEEPLTRGVWIWADSRAAGLEYLEQLRDELGDAARSLVKTHHTLYLCDGGRIGTEIPKNRPEGERVIAVWLATSAIPNEYLGRLLHLGQCEEFWARPGTVPDLPEGMEWRKGTL
ncbi:MAG: hypothetical protein R6X02_13900 [Enhygromyxa sp.]